MFGTLATLRKPLIAMISGHCTGAGMAVALGADMRIAAEGSRFAIQAARLGIGYPVALTQALVHATGPEHAADVLYTGRTLADVEALVATLAANAPLSVATAKPAIRSAAHPELEGPANDLVAACIGSEDAREGQRAFLAKRAPVFEGGDRDGW